MTSPRSRLHDRGLDAALNLLGAGGRPIGLPVKGRSMVPTLVEGQWIVCELHPTRLALGDLLVFDWPGDLESGPLDPKVGLAVHRLVGRRRTEDGDVRLLTRGDGKGVLDPPVPPSIVLARVLAVGDGTAWRTVRSRPARAYALALALHDRFWAGLLAWAEDVDADIPLGRGVSVRRFLWALDRRLLRLVHRSLFRLLHARVEVPGAGEWAARLGSR